MDPYRSGGMPSPTTSRFPAGARGGNFLPPVSGPPTPNRLQMRRPSQTTAPSPRDAASPSHPPTMGSAGPSPQTPSGSVDRQNNLALGSPPVWRRASGPDQVRAGQVVLGSKDDGPPGTPARKSSVGVQYGTGRSPGYGLGISSPGGGPAQQSTVSPGPPPRMSRVPSKERMQGTVMAPFSQSSPRQRPAESPSLSAHHAKSPSAPLAHLSPDPARRVQDRQASDPDFRAAQQQQQQQQSRHAGSMNEALSASPGFSSSSRPAATERKISVSLERDGSDPAISSPLSHYPSAVNGKPASTPPARPRHASSDLVLLPHQQEPPLSTPPHTKIDRARDSRVGSASGGAASKIMSVGRASMDENAHYRSPVGPDRRSASGDLGKKKADSPKSATPRKSSGVLRSLFGKKKDSAPSPSATSPTATSSPVVASGVNGTSTLSRLGVQRGGEPPSRPSPMLRTTTPPEERMSRPRTGSSPSLSGPTPHPPPRRPSAGPEYHLAAPPPPQIPLPSLLSTDSTGLLSSSDSIPSLQSRETSAVGKKAVNLLRRLSDQSSHSASSLSYLASEPSAASNRAPLDMPHLKSSGSLRLLALPDFGSTLELGEDIGMLADALRQPVVEDGSGSFQPQLDGEDSWSSLLAAMSSGSPEMISAAFEGARQSIALQNNSELDRALADLQLEVSKQVSNLSSSRSLDAVGSPAPASAALPPSPKLEEDASAPPSAPIPALPAAPAPTPIKNPNLTITVVKPPPSSFKHATKPSVVAPLHVAKRTLSAPIVSPDQATGLYSSPVSTNSGQLPAEAVESADKVPVMTSTSLPSLRPTPAFRPPPFSGRTLSIGAARRQRQRKMLNYRLMAEKMGECLAAVRSSAARAPLIRGVLLPLLYDVERCGFDPNSFAENKLMRACCFEWLVGLVTKDLWLDHTPSERGAILEAVATLVESPALSERALASDPADAAVFRKVLRTVVSFVMIKLSSKGIFQNTLSFAGRMLAFAFFRVEGIAQQLLTSMPITRMALVRMETQLQETEARSPRMSYKHEAEPFPPFLTPFSMSDPREYIEELGRSSCYFDDPEDEAAFRFQPGNWLRRWQSDDSELFFSFFRAYHRRLSTFFPSVQEAEGSEQLVTSVLFKVPGYAHLATVFTSKCVSYVQGKINSVTTTSSAATFSSTETAGFAGNSGKPPVLESANRRLSETIILLLSSPTIVDLEYGTEVDGARLFGAVSELWFRILVSRTNMYEPKGVFCLFDLLDVVTTVPPDPFKEMPLIHTPPLAFTTVFLITPLSILLRNSDHALTLCKCVSYVFQHWDSLMADPVDRSALLDLLLDQAIFDRLALFWSQSVRSYVVRLIVFRLSHISQRAGGPTPAEVHMVATLNSRLERIRRRHADLEPSVLGAILEDDASNSLVPPTSPGLKRSRSTIAMVRLPSESSSLTADEYVPSGAGEPSNGAARPSSTLDPGAEIMAGAGGSAVGKATQWFKRSFGGGGAKKKRGSGDNLSSQSSSKTLTSVAEDVSEGAISPISPTNPLPPSPSASTTQHPPLFSALPSPSQSSVLSPARSSFESSGMPSPADFFFSEEEERKLNAADAFKPSGLALPGTTLPRNNPFINASLASNTPESPTTSLANYTFGSRGSADSSSSSGTATPTATSQSPANPTGVFSFGFAASPVSDAFEVNASAPTVPSIVLPPGQSAHPPPSPISPTNNRMSRSFSRRSTLLTPLASHILEDLANAGEEPSKIAAAFAAHKEKEAGYDKKLHPYAVQFLAELELTMEEYAEWYGPSGAGTLSADGAPPRLSVGWNFHDDD